MKGGEMGKGARLKEVKMKPLQPGQKVQVDLKNATQQACGCGCKLFTPAVQLYHVSAFVSPTGQELTAQQPVLVCLECREVFVGSNAKLA
jgi:hypothetical protein